MSSSARTLQTSSPHPAPVAVAAAIGRDIDVESLFKAHAAMVAAIGFRILGRTAEVEDLVQDVFVDACRDREKIRNPESIKSWLAVCAIRRARRLLRQRRLKRLLGLDTPADYEQVADASASPAERLLLSRVYRVLDEIAVEERLAWTLRHVDGQDLETVARLCGCSLATAKRRIAAAALIITKRLA